MAETTGWDKIGTVDFCNTKMQKELVLQKLREKGCRITKQRQMLLDVILQDEFASCKEIYYKVKKENNRIGVATVYRMINLLEEIGAISRNNMYKLSCCMDCERENACAIELNDHTVVHLSTQRWFHVILEGLKACGYVDQQSIVSMELEPFGFSVLPVIERLHEKDYH